eukprot:COSAG05_NODE_4119_length_1665_cov_2.167305_1_plen_136_part_00
MQYLRSVTPEQVRQWELTRCTDIDEGVPPPSAPQEPSSIGQAASGHSDVAQWGVSCVGAQAERTSAVSVPANVSNWGTGPVKGGGQPAAIVEVNQAATKTNFDGNSGSIGFTIGDDEFAGDSVRSSGKVARFFGR